MRFLLFAAVCLAPGLRAQEGGIEIFAGETLFESGWRASVSQLYKVKRDLYQGRHTVSDPLARSFVEHRTVLGLDYGLERSTTLSVLVPFVFRELETGGRTLRSSGAGDVVLIGKHRIVHVEGRGNAFNVALIGGLETPTGATSRTDGGMRLAPGLQPGSGAWNPFVAASVTAGLDRARFDATFFFKLNTEGAQQFEDGDFWSVDVSAAYRFLHYQYPGPTFGARLGLQWRHVGHAETAGVRAPNSGADELLLKAALSIHPIPRVDLNVGARIPVWLDYDGQQLGRDVELFVAVGIRF